MFREFVDFQNSYIIYCFKQNHVTFPVAAMAKLLQWNGLAVAVERVSIVMERLPIAMEPLNCCNWERLSCCDGTA